MDTARIALVTGANRGIGLEIARQLAAKGLRVILTARNLDEANRAATKLPGDGSHITARQLDVSDPASVERLANSLATDFGRLDVLVNNAGVLLDRNQQGANVDMKTVEVTLQTNLLGAWRLSQALLPLLKKSGRGRIVNVSSQMGQLESMSGGYPAYRVSKTALNALTRILADELRGSGILVNAACPGWVRTDMGGASAPRSVAEGADTPVWLATLPDDGPTGGFFQNRRPIPW
jgi:NAD(P)-dependent dehydrogenase (short-subunit alcohol dehydrogenase family)